MMCRRFSSQKGFSLIRFVILLCILGAVALIILNFLPRIGGGTFDVLNQIASKAKSVVNGITSRISALGPKLAQIGEKLSRLIEDLKDWWYRYQHKDEFGSEGFKSRSIDWLADMNSLIDLAQEQGYKMGEVKKLLDRYEEGTASAVRVETIFWQQIIDQTVEVINKNIKSFRQRPLGCSDFTEELIKIWEIEQKFNEETLDGYFEARRLSQELDDPRSLGFTQDLFGWIGYHNSAWFMEQLNNALPSGNQTPDYPTIIEQIDERMRSTNNPFDCVLGNISVAEIYLNYNLINPAENRFDEAIRHLSTILGHYGNSIAPERVVGLHMALGLLNERVCKNNDLAVKEFKDVIANARRIGLQCETYNDAHYHLGIINLRLLETAEVGPAFEEEKRETSEDILPPVPDATPTPVPTPTPTPTPTPNPIKIEITIPRSRRLQEDAPEGVKSRDLMPGVVKGDVVVQRALRAKPIGDVQKMKGFSVGQLYDLSSIPDGAIREFEFYLQCTSSGPRTDIARYVHKQYLGR